jgi:membrane associated rhomboid family serine protease
MCYIVSPAETVRFQDLAETGRRECPMIPLRDIDRKRLGFPAVTAMIIGMNVLMFLLESVNGRGFILRWSLIPAEITAGRGTITILTAMFMHASVLHIMGNMVYLMAFGPELEGVMGRGRYLVFYLLGGLAATVAQVAMDPTSVVPNLGASGAIAAVMGAFLVTFPHDRIRTLLVIGFYVTISFIPAVILVGFWFVIQLFSEVGALVQRQGVGVAYMAHIGGLIFGVVTARLFEPRQRRILYGLEER